tara:strand:- start:1251 stop:1535 length:285 start_codon:yes stop_codon:yes gene_type:complete
MSGDAKQNAITGASGTPAISSPAMIGTTPQEQNGDRAPKRDAIIIDLKGWPENTMLICRSEPVALANDASKTDASKKMKIPLSASPIKIILSVS